jgi:hypothetical protein
MNLDTPIRLTSHVTFLTADYYLSYLSLVIHTEVPLKLNTKAIVQDTIGFLRANEMTKTGPDVCNRTNLTAYILDRHYILNPNALFCNSHQTTPY